MLRLGLNGWVSEFPDEAGARRPIVPNGGQATVASYRSLTGGHAMLYLEYIEPGTGDAITKKIHLLAGAEGSGTAESTGSGSSASGSTGSLEIEIQEEELARNVESDQRSQNYYYKGYPITDAQRAALEAAALRFKTKNAGGRYQYRLAGGVIGRLTTRPGTRGVNCADFVIKIMDEAGVARLESKIFNTPARIAGR